MEVYGVTPLVLRPNAFRQKPGTSGAVVDFDAVYGELIEPAIEAGSSRCAPIRSWWRHHPQADVRATDTRATSRSPISPPRTPNVFYELGVRHAVRPASTLLLMPSEPAGCHSTSADPRPAVRYGPDGKPADASARAAISKRLTEARSCARQPRVPTCRRVSRYSAPEDGRVPRSRPLSRGCEGATDRIAQIY